jgi:tripartite-type tricarboxylate transporter receptor subunit TctC
VIRTLTVAGCAAVFAAGGACALAAQGELYPSRPIRILATTTPGSGPDIMARLIGTKLTEAWGQQVVVDNRGGASGIIGTEIAARAAPDGYTLLIMTSSHVIVQALFQKLNYDLLRDFVPIGLIATTPFILAVNPSVAAHSLKDLIALAKARPGELRYGTGGAGTPPHLATEILAGETGIQLLHVPYKGIVPALTDAVAGQIQMMIAVIPSALPMIKSGKLRALAITGAKRSALVPEVPTVAETVPGYEVIGWYGLAAPRGTPGDIVSRLNAETTKALQTPEFQERIAALGAEAAGSTPQEFDRFRRAETAKLRKAVKAANLHRD